MNEFDKILILKKIDEELKHLDELKSLAFKTMFTAKTRGRLDLHEKAWREYNRLSDKMDGVFLSRGLITGCESVVCYQERESKKVIQQSIDILSSDSIEQRR